MSKTDADRVPIPYAEALALIARHIRPLGRETVALADAAGRRLAQPARARHHAPRFEQSSMDGYAVRTTDLAGASPSAPVALRLVGSLPAGSRDSLRIGPGETASVYTGGRLPRGADAVVMVEHAARDADIVTLAAAASAGQHVRRVGEEYRKGDEVLPAGLRVTPPVIGMLALLGHDRVVVGRIPSVTVITMGDELVAPGGRLAPGTIHDGNGPALVAALRGCGLRRVEQRRVGDTRAGLRRSLAAALERSDLVITCGGASVGDHDHAAGARRDLGLRELFSRVAIKPGKPNIFGLAPGGVPVCSLPGNPVSALVSFHQLVRPLLQIQMGALPAAAPTLPVVLAAGKTKKPGRLEWLRAQARREGGSLVADPAAKQGSHMLSALAMADLLVELPAGAAGARAGESLTAYPLDWGG